MGAAFVVVGAIIQEYHHDWWKASLPFLVRLRCVSKRVASGGNTNLRPEPVGEARDKNNSVSERSILLRVSEGWKDLKLWWHDPIDRSLPLENNLTHIKRSVTAPMISPGLSQQNSKEPFATIPPVFDASSSSRLPPNSKAASS